MTFKPLFDRVLVKAEICENKTENGIFIPSTSEERPLVATVVKIGTDKDYDGKEINYQVKVGDKILYSRYSGIEVKIEDESFILLKQADIMGIFEE